MYETDISRVKVGQKALIKTSATTEALTGKVERISLKVGRLDVIGTDPIAKTDARVVEVFILLDESDPALLSVPKPALKSVVEDRVIVAPPIGGLEVLDEAPV